MNCHQSDQSSSTNMQSEVDGWEVEKNSMDDAAAQTAKAIISLVEHELRTPLTVILASVESLSKSSPNALTTEQRHSVDAIQKYGRHLHALIEQILDYADLVRNQVQRGHMHIALSQLADTCIEMVQPLADAKKIEIQYNDRSSEMTVLGNTVLGNVEHLQHLFIIILSNAIKFTPINGEIGLEIGDGPDSRTGQIIIWDTGPSIPFDRVEDIFQPFVQLDSSITREHYGLGLGLAIAQKVVQQHGGMISVRDHANGGNSFVITLPLSIG